MTAAEAKQTEQEASLLARLNHPNIVAFWESFVGGDNLYIVMEFANGTTSPMLRVLFSSIHSSLLYSILRFSSIIFMKEIIMEMGLKNFMRF